MSRGSRPAKNEKFMAMNSTAENNVSIRACALFLTKK